MRPAATLFALLLSTSAAAADNPPPAWQGVWRGTIGTIGITACLRPDYDGPAGVYYYAKHLQTIRLAAPEKFDPATLVFHEDAGGEDPSKLPTWTLKPPAAGEMRGQWSGNGKQLPIKLKRIPLAAPDLEQSPCSSGAFNDPLEKPATLVVGKAQPGFRTLELDFGGRFNAELSSFELIAATPGIARVNAALRTSLMDEQDNVFSCSRNILDQNGHSGEYMVTTTPELIAGRWLVTATASSNSCGGAHPNYDRSFGTWDLAGGKAVDPWTWFVPAAARRMSKNKEGSYEALEIKPVLKALIDKGWAAISEAECRDAPGSDDNTWMLRPTRSGMAFTPSLAHVVHACTGDVLIPYSTLSKWMTPAGKAAAAEISAAATAK